MNEIKKAIQKLVIEIQCPYCKMVIQRRGYYESHSIHTCDNCKNKYEIVDEWQDKVEELIGNIKKTSHEHKVDRSIITFR